MKVYLFQRRFAALVQQGKKRTTIRPKRKRPTKVGDWLSLRRWSGKPYRSKQEVLLTDGSCVVQCKEAHEIEMFDQMRGDVMVFIIKVDGKSLNKYQSNEVATADGFVDWYDMAYWFRREHGLPFKGDLVKW